MSVHTYSIDVDRRTLPEALSHIRDRKIEIVANAKAGEPGSPASMVIQKDGMSRSEAASIPGVSDVFDLD